MNYSFIREPVLLDQFYPSDPVKLRSMVRDFIDAATTEEITPRAIIAPHAGYVFSGPVAGSAYAYIEKHKTAYKRAVLIGPAHRCAFAGLALSTASAFKTPLGEIPLDTGAADELSDLKYVKPLDEPHEYEHCLEVQLPFIQMTLGGIPIVPLLAGDIAPLDIAEAISLLMKKPGTLMIISSDLSHYYNYEDAKEIDAKTAKSIENLAAKEIGTEDACGCQPIRGLLLYAQKENLHITTVHLANSMDTSHMGGRVVGYGAFIAY